MCLFPRLISNRKYTPNKKNKGVVDYETMVLTNFDKRVLAVPIGCGFCMECRKNKKREWQIRLLEDVKHNTNGKFVTLTFSDDSIKALEEKVQETKTKIKTGIKSSWVNKNGKLCVRYKYKILKEKKVIGGYALDNAIAKYAMRKFLERWRKEEKKSLRHWTITELGHKGTENIHLHGIIWTDKTEEYVKNKWTYGYVWYGKKKRSRTINYVNGRTVNYITKYVQKVDFDHFYYKPIILSSGGIGKGYFDRTDWMQNIYKRGETKEYYKTDTGHKMKLPIYYRNKIYSDEEKEKLWIEKLDGRYRYVGGEKIDTKDGYENYFKALRWYRAKNKSLGYGTSEIQWNRKDYEEDRRRMMLDTRINRTAHTH